MKKLPRAIFIGALVLASSGAFASRTEPLKPAIENILITTTSGKSLSKEQVKQSIILAATAAKWTATTSADGQIVATLNVRGKHTLIVEIPYSTQHYTVRYKDSENLNHGMEELEQNNYRPVEVIHPNANKWMAQLKDAIRAEFARQ